jgi:FkbM family methyltransferase
MGRLTRSDITAAYELLLGREPESDDAIDGHLEETSVASLLQRLVASPEFKRRWQRSPFFYFNSVLDPEALIRAHADPARKPKPGHLVNFLGVAMNREFMPHLRHSDDTVEDLPIPANWHADMAEFAACLRAVDLASKQFRMIELGCGWGCWMNNTGVAARRRGLSIHVTGVEGDGGHLAFAHEALATNGIRPDEYRLLRGIVGAERGVALFPRQHRSGSDWGLEARPAGPVEARKWALRMNRYEPVEVLALDNVIGAEKRIDLLHIDIQGGEAVLIRDCLATLNAKVAYLVIGTHSRAIEGYLMTLLLDAGWVVEIERPSIFEIRRKGPQTTVDGLQGWRNPRLANG